MKTVGLVFKKKAGNRRSAEPDKEHQNNTVTQPSQTPNTPEEPDKED